MTIIIYSTSTCAACQALTNWLDKQGCSYTKKITDDDQAAMAEFMSLNDGMIGVPFTVITSDQGAVTKISGFDQRAFREALKPVM